MNACECVYRSVGVLQKCFLSIFCVLEEQIFFCPSKCVFSLTGQEADQKLIKFFVALKNFYPIFRHQIHFLMNQCFVIV